MQLAGIQNIIFDFGGVILNIDHLKPIEAFKKLGINDFEALYSQAIQSDLFDRLETGLIGSGEFRSELRTLCNIPLSDEQIDSAWNSILLDIPLPRILLIEKLRSRYRTFLLSNTNEIHYSAYLEILKKTSGHPNFDSLFEKALFSFMIGKRKPYAATYDWVMSTYKLKPEETILIDDSFQNIEGAQKCGLRTYFLEPHMDIINIFNPKTFEFNSLGDDIL